MEDAVFSAFVPSGKSTGKYEAVELRDGDKSKYLGKGVLNAVENVKKISTRLMGMNVLKQEIIDQAMIDLDGTPNKSFLGANAILGVSMCVARAAASHLNVHLWQYIAELAQNYKPSLPYPYLNVINGGKHADNEIACQEFMICPEKATSFAESMRQGCEVYHKLKDIIKKKFGSTGVGDEGGFAPGSKTMDEALSMLSEAMAIHPGIRVGLDVAASEFFDEKTKKYDLGFKADKPHTLTGKELADVYLDLVKKFPIKSIEDPFDQDDVESFKDLMTRKPAPLQVIGDDLLVTNLERIKDAHKNNLVNSLLLKVNQIGTLTESIKAAQFCFKNNWKVMVSHRSGETEDSFIADLVVGINAGQIKTGAPCRSERLSKYNRLLEIEEEMSQAGLKNAFPPQA